MKVTAAVFLLDKKYHYSFFVKVIICKNALLDFAWILPSSTGFRSTKLDFMAFLDYKCVIQTDGL